MSNSKYLIRFSILILFLFFFNLEIPHSYDSLTLDSAHLIHTPLGSRLCPPFLKPINLTSPTGELALPIVEDCQEAAAISWDFIDKIIYINPENSTDRNEAMLRDFLPVFQKSAGDIIRYEAITDSSMNHPQRVARSHIGALEEALEKGFKNVLILEDDVLWRVDPNRTNLFLLQQLVKRPYDVIVLGGTAAIFDGVQRVVYAQTTSAYLVNGKYIPKVLGIFQDAVEFLDQEHGNHFFAIDVWWHWLMKKDNWYIVTPALVIQSFHTIGYGYSNDGT